MIPVAQMIKDHANTVFYIRRFGPAASRNDLPLSCPIRSRPRKAGTSAALRGLLGKTQAAAERPAQLAKYPEIERHFNRSREIFYHAESLPDFRDSIDPGAFDAIGRNLPRQRGHIRHGPRGRPRPRRSTVNSRHSTPNCNALCTRVKTQDKQGFCHHLANDDRFTWVKKNA